MKVKRFDRGALHRPKILENGWRKLDAYLSRTGVFVYEREDGTTRRELRLPEEVFSKDTLESFALVPLTNNHPPSLLHAGNTKDYAVGTVGESIRPDGDFVRASLFLTDKKAVAEVEGGKQELSCGYLCDIEEVSGEWNGLSFDAIQRNIRGNHVALVERGRAGPLVRARMDAGDAVMVSVPDVSSDKKYDSESDQKGDAMKTIQIDGVVYEVSEQVAQAYQKEKDQFAAWLDAKEEACNQSKKEMEALQARLDANEEERKKAEQARLDAQDPARIAALVKKRVALEVDAKTHLAENVTLDGLSDQEIQVLVIQAYSPTFEANDKSPEYIQARYDATLEIMPDEPNVLAQARTTLDAAAHASIGKNLETARAKQAERSREAWKQAN